MTDRSHLKVERDLAAVSYGITGIRVVLGIIAALIIHGTALIPFDSKVSVGALVLAIMVLDYFDGFTFEKSGLDGDYLSRIRRRFADSLADRAVIQLVCLPLFLTQSGFAWIYFAILAREIVISSFHVYQYSKGCVIYPRLISKVACAMVGVSTIASLFPGKSAALFTILMTMLSLVSLLEYYFRSLSRTSHKEFSGGFSEIF